ncbi:MAG TPA: DUF1329 domain-containing protein [Methylibium sp.]|nr:DUF1329 domain-containing protein [Methylibium sp.]
MSKKLILTQVGAVASACLLAAGGAFAAASADEAKKLGATLTEFGAEKGANADGSIPAYTGGLTQPPAGWSKGADQYVDPFKDDKPLYVIDGKNAAKYDALLSEGEKAMLATHPTFRMDVYPTRRSVAYPAWVLENTTKNATTATLTGEVEGDAMKGGAPDGLPFAGVPFPIPKTGYEVMWNHKTNFGPAVGHQFSQAFLIDTSGSITPLPTTNEYFVRPWYDKSGNLRKQTFDATFGFSAKLQSPPSSAGIHFLNYYLPNSAEGGQKVWFYTPGQRRVRAAPEFGYDVPIAAYGGVLFWDEIFGFVGRMDRFNFKLVGKKEMIVPYNVFGFTNQLPSKAAIGPKHLVPDTTRWEKRRIWVVDSTRKDGARHAYSRRTFYIEEDCWCIVGSDSYDNGGKLWRVARIYSFPTYDVGGVNTSSWTFNDMIKGNYFVVNMGHKDPGFFVRSHADAENLPGLQLTPAAVAAGSIR